MHLCPQTCTVAIIRLSLHDFALQHSQLLRFLQRKSSEQVNNSSQNPLSLMEKYSIQSSCVSLSCSQVTSQVTCQVTSSHVDGFSVMSVLQKSI